MMDVSSLSMASMAKVSMASLSRGSEVSRTIGEGSADGSEPRTPSRRNRRRARAKPRTPSIEELDLGGWFHPDGSMTYKPSASAATRRPSSADRGVPFWERFKEADNTTPKRPRSAAGMSQTRRRVEEARSADQRLGVSLGEDALNSSWQSLLVRHAHSDSHCPFSFG